MVEEKVIAIARDESGLYLKKKFGTAYRLVRKWVKDYAGYNQGKRTGNLVPSPQNILKKSFYLRKFFENRALPPEDRKREVYTDESYIHEHYKGADDSLWDPDDDQDVKTTKDKHKGRRYCFCAAIQGPNPRVAVPVLNEDKAGMVPGSLWAFCPQKKNDHQGDYHKVFNGNNYVKWWTDQLLPSLRIPSIIILDNAAYHMVHGHDVPKWSKMKKQDCIDYLQQKNVPFQTTMHAVELKGLVRKYIQDNEKPQIIRLAEEAGHEVLFTPPNYSDLQPIELAWAYVKGNVGRQYSIETTLTIVHDRLMQEFTRLSNDHGAVLGMIDKCSTLAKKFLDEIVQDEADFDEDDDGEDDSSSSEAEEEEAFEDNDNDDVIGQMVEV
jgi:transposase